MKRNEKGFSAVEIILVLLVVGLIGVVGFMVYKNHNKTTNSTTSTSSSSPTTTQKTTSNTQLTIPSDWTWYENNDLGFKFAYPSSWGKANLTFADKGDVGMQYELDFYPSPSYKAVEQYNSRTPITISFASDDYSMKSCNDGGCRTQVAMYTKAKIQQILDSIVSGSYSTNDNGTLLSHNSKSFTTIATKVANTDGAHPDTVDLVNERFIVAIPKISVSGVNVEYSIINTPTTCLSNKLSDNSETMCLNQNIVDTVSKLSSSITALN